MRPASSSALILCVAVGASGCDRESRSHSLAEPARRVDLGTLNGLTSLPLKHYGVRDPVYHRMKRYEGYALGDVIRVAFGSRASHDPRVDLAFICADGYDPVIALDRVDDRALLAIRDMEAAPGSSWEPIPKGREQVSPAPYYLVWRDLTEGAETDFPWPYQVVALELRTRR